MGFKYGEIVLAICIRSKKGTRSLPKKSRCLFKLERGGMARGAVAHDDLVSRGLEHAEVNGVVFRRPTLDEYVVMMKRVPTPTYPDDARAMAAILDLNEGSKVLEAGSGSGGLSLYLSKNGNLSVCTLGMYSSVGWMSYIARKCPKFTTINCENKTYNNYYTHVYTPSVVHYFCNWTKSYL